MPYSADVIFDTWSAQKNTMCITQTNSTESPSTLLGQLFYRSQIPVGPRFLAKNKNADAKRGFCNRLGLDN
jgi:hypothetical protein